MSEIHVPDEAVAALDAAMDAEGFVDGGAALSLPDNGFDPANQGISQGETQDPNVATPQPGVTQPTEPVAPAEGEQQTPAPTEDSFAERFDPNSLPAELQSAYKLMQADYTRKRQADAEAIRLAQQYQGVDLDTAVQLFQAIQDPQGLADFVQNASQHLVENGFAEFDGDPGVVQEQGPGANNLAEALATLSSDPEMAPLAEAVQSMQARLDSFEAQSEQRLAAEREEALTLRAMGELQRMENVIRTDNPHYGDGDVDAIYELASHFDGDLLAAQQRYEAIFANRLGRYMQQKESAPAPAVPTGLPQAVPTTELQYDPLDPKQAHQAALDVLKLIESQPE